MRSGRAFRIVVKHHEMPGPRKAFFDPTNVMLAKERLVLLRSARIRSRIAPAIEQVPAFLPAPTAVAGRLRRRRAVVDDPNFVKLRSAESDLIELGVVRDRVHVQQIRSNVALLRAGGDV